MRRYGHAAAAGRPIRMQVDRAEASSGSRSPPASSSTGCRSRSRSNWRRRRTFHDAPGRDPGRKRRRSLRCDATNARQRPDEAVRDRSPRRDRTRARRLNRPRSNRARGREPIPRRHPQAVASGAILAARGGDRAARLLGGEPLGSDASVVGSSVAICSARTGQARPTGGLSRTSSPIAYRQRRPSPSVRPTTRRRRRARHDLTGDRPIVGAGRHRLNYLRPSGRRSCLLSRLVTEDASRGSSGVRRSGRASRSRSGSLTARERRW